MKSVPLKVYPRTAARRGPVKHLRTTGRIPAVIYGGKIPPQNLEIASREFELLIHGAASENVLVDLSIEGDAGAKRLALIQEVQHHALSGHVLHVDFHQVATDEKVTITVPVETVGEPAGVKNSGGTLEHIMFRIRVRAFPQDLPEVINLDVTNLEVGKSIHLGDIVPPVGVEILGKKNLTVVAVAAPITEAQETAATDAAGAVAQPEMIKEKKEDGAAKPGAAKGGAAKADPKAGDKKPADKKK